MYRSIKAKKFQVTLTFCFWIEHGCYLCGKVSGLGENIWGNHRLAANEIEVSNGAESSKSSSVAVNSVSECSKTVEWCVSKFGCLRIVPYDWQDWNNTQFDFSSLHVQNWYGSDRSKIFKSVSSQHNVVLLCFSPLCNRMLGQRQSVADNITWPHLSLLHCHN